MAKPSKSTPAKASPKSTPAKASRTQQQSQTPEATPHALDELQNQVGKPDPAHLEDFLAGTSDAELVDMGRSISTARVITDCSRIYTGAWEFWQQASAAQKGRLKGFSPALLALAVDQAVQLKELEALHAGKTQEAAAKRTLNETAADQAFSSGLGLRDQASGALSDVAGQDEELLTQVATAKGTAANAEELALGLERLAGLLREWADSKNEGLIGRLALASLDKEYATELDGAAKDVRKKGASATQRPAGGKVTQGQLDRGDGLNVRLLGQVIGAFDGANKLDPTIPRLLPISTRRVFNRNTKKKDAGDGGKKGGGDGGGKKDGGG